MFSRLKAKRQSRFECWFDAAARPLCILLMCWPSVGGSIALAAQPPQECTIRIPIAPSGSRRFPWRRRSRNRGGCVSQTSSRVPMFTQAGSNYQKIDAMSGRRSRGAFRPDASSTKSSAGGRQRCEPTPATCERFGGPLRGGRSSSRTAGGFQRVTRAQAIALCLTRTLGTSDPAKKSALPLALECLTGGPAAFAHPRFNSCVF